MNSRAVYDIVDVRGLEVWLAQMKACQTKMYFKLAPWNMCYLLLLTCSSVEIILPRNFTMFNLYFRKCLRCN